MTEFNNPKICPVAMAARLLEPRWTMLVLCEMWAGSTRFNAIQRGVPGMSPELLSKRLKEMEFNGLVTRRKNDSTGHAEYLTTSLADDVETLIRGLGAWAHSNIDCTVSLQDLDARLLMSKIRGKINLLELPKRKCVIQFILNDPPNDTKNYWLVATPGEEIDLCFTDPRFDVDLFVVCELRALTSAWMGHSTFKQEIRREKITLMDHDKMASTLTSWLVRSSFADLPNR